MKRLGKRIWNANVRLWWLLSILFFSVVLFFEHYTASLGRFLEALRDLGTSCAHWFFFVFEEPLRANFGAIEFPHATILDFPAITFEEILGIDFTALFAKFRSFPDTFPASFGAYNEWLFKTLYLIALILMALTPFLLYLIPYGKKASLTKSDQEVGTVRRSAKVLLWIVKKCFVPIGKLVREFIDFMAEHKRITYFLFFVWLLNFNVITVGLEAFSFYFYFISSFDFLAVLLFLLKLLFDVLILLFCMPLLYWAVVSFRVYYRYREFQALDELRHMEAKNCGYLKTLDIVTLIIGEPGKGKTTLLTDFVLSWVNIYKEESLRILYKYEMMFPAFCFGKFREDLIDKIEQHEIFCLPQVNDYVDKLFADYEDTKDKGLLYGYDADFCRMTVDIGMRVVSLKEAMKIYGRAFLVYYNNNPSLSNYPIRFDGNFDDSKYMKRWNGDFFTRKKESRFSRILNQDMLRHGRKMDPSSAYNGTFGYGVYSHTELAKSVGNQNTNAQYKAEAKECNPKNDKHSYAYMMGRHPFSTVDNFVFFRFIGDEQRASSLMAEELGLMSVLSIGEKSDLKLAIEGFDWLYDLKNNLDKKFNKFYWQRENVRGDVTVSMLCLKHVISFLRLACERLDNRFGYRETELIRQQGSAFSGNQGTTNTAGAAQSHIYYQMNMKDYSDRFMTDCYSQLYAKAQKACGMGIMDMQEYSSLGMTPEEMDLQNDHFMKKLMKMIHGPEEFEEVAKN